VTPRSKRARHVAVTGAGTGIGRAIALRLAQKRTRLSLFARDVERLEATAKAAGGLGAETFVARCDVRKKKDVDAAFAAAAAELGPFHALVANSGIGGPNVPDARDRFEDIVATNLSGTYFTVRAAQRRLAPGPGPRHVVVISSILARIGVAGYAGYCASKAGLLGLVRSFAVELAPLDVQVNAVCPGWVNTDMARAGLEDMAKALGISIDEALRRALAEVPLGRMSEPEDVAGVVAWLLSPDARGVTGQAIDVNGGAFMH
jgi:NAD(P)-dependent dehydrogenase (short-subunit alcohol dehydrogenase family)